MRLRGCLHLLLLSLLALPAAAQDPSALIGRTAFVKGVVTAQVPDGNVRILAAKGNVFRHDVITTSTRSYAVLSMGDGTRLTLRENSVLALEEYEFQDAERPSAVLRLFKGGLRAITGLISKRNKRGFSLRTSVATIGIRGTSFEARLCDKTCLEEARRVRARPVATSPVVARVVFLRGQATAQRGGGGPRDLSLGASLYESDVVETAPQAVAVITFKDRSRVTLRAASRFKIEEMRYEPENAQKDGMFLRLLKGGLRSVSGLISRRSKNRVGLRAATATIGIRGTGIDLACDGECADSGAQGAAPEGLVPDSIRRFVDYLVRPAYAQAGQVFVLFWQGSGTLSNSGTDLPLSQGQIGVIRTPLGPPQRFEGSLPRLLQELQVLPRPDDEKSIDPGLRGPVDDLFATSERDEAAEGTLIVLVDEGDVEVDGVHVGAGEGVIAGGPEARPVRVLAPRMRVIRLPSPDLLIEGGLLLQELSTHFDIEFRDNGQMCLSL